MVRISRMSETRWSEISAITSVILVPQFVINCALTVTSLCVVKPEQRRAEPRSRRHEYDMSIELDKVQPEVGVK